MRRIKIIGGGIAGLSLGILLRRMSIPVTVFEAGTYPRHRVCGEFISGAGTAILERLGVFPALVRAGAGFAETVEFFSAGGPILRQQLEVPALTISRWTLDAALAAEFRNSGGELRESERVSESDREGMVWANGRRVAERRGPWRWLGLKGHADHVTLAADLEMHVRPNSYVGLCAVEGGRVNVCGLFRLRSPERAVRDTWVDLLRGPAGTPLADRLREAEFQPESFCAVAGFTWNWGSREDEVCLGDHYGMIAPVTGNGMSLAMESADLAAAPLAAYSRGASSWESARREIGQRLDRKMGARLRCSAWLQGVLLREWPGWVWSGIPMKRRIFRWCYERTRSLD